MKLSNYENCAFGAPSKCWIGGHGTRGCLHLRKMDRFRESIIGGRSAAIQSRRGMAALTPAAENPVTAGADAMGQAAVDVAPSDPFDYE
jgi:hypothetical protein